MITKGCAVLNKSTEYYDVIIAGGGPSGLFCAVSASEGKNRVLVIEKNEICGKKLLISGLSQCNITQSGDIKNFFIKYGDKEKGNFLKPSLFNFTNDDLVNFFNERGLETVVEKQNKVFPVSKKSSDVLEVLLDECSAKNVIIKCGETLTKACFEDSSFLVETLAKRYSCRSLVIATGGITYPKTGSTGDGYKIAEHFGHTVKKASPALCPVYVRDNHFACLSGISFKNAGISLYRRNKKEKELFGDILFTHRGLSGPGILHISRYAEPGDTIKISFIGKIRKEDFLKDFTEKISLNGTKSVKSVITGYGLYERFARRILDLLEIKHDQKCAHLSKSKRNDISEGICDHPFVIDSIGGLNEGMVTKGGVDLKEVNPKTMESRICRNLYFTGEVLDIDGDTGGYNLQAAFSTGYLAGQNISSN
ncbi:putative Rossmann fold flavoprotein [Methanomicrobium sp. W14]|uniref:NAD(P)/FAD-dependent oxidoreductase n=1 Tax=Methanomicrobium sp. W14 TaxID=2817839 RepID=UPI001FDA4800|nr:NAD(P)/FAD-dependent oxidoreductase [Methanomicrobium sp. W14]MBP2133720.1 putative Rossmann fold flavoprotein [Methanomicrobium sp. W14]